MTNTKYWIGSLLVLPLLPVLYWQGKKIRAGIPALPPARGPEGTAGSGNGPALRLLALGESTIAGIGVDTHAEGFTGALAAALSRSLDATVHWKVYASSGYTARQVTQRIIPEISENTADLIVIGLGGNDAFQLNRPGRWRTHILELIAALRQKFGNTSIAFTNMPPIKEFPAFTPLIKATIGNLVELLGAELERLVREKENVYFFAEKITLAGWTGRLGIEAEPGDFFSDGVHPSRLTYQVWAREFAAFLLRQEEIRNRLLSEV